MVKPIISMMNYKINSITIIILINDESIRHILDFIIPKLPCILTNMSVCFATTEEEAEPAEEDIQKEKKFIVFESCLFKLLKQCCSCGKQADDYLQTRKPVMSLSRQESQNGRGERQQEEIIFFVGIQNQTSTS